MGLWQTQFLLLFIPYSPFNLLSFFRHTRGLEEASPAAAAPCVCGFVQKGDGPGFKEAWKARGSVFQPQQNNVNMTDSFKAAVLNTLARILLKERGVVLILNRHVTSSQF